MFSESGKTCLVVRCRLVLIHSVLHVLQEHRIVEFSHVVLHEEDRIIGLCRKAGLDARAPRERNVFGREGRDCSSRAVKVVPIAIWARPIPIALTSSRFTSIGMSVTGAQTVRGSRTTVRLW